MTITTQEIPRPGWGPYFEELTNVLGTANGEQHQWLIHLERPTALPAG